MKYALFFAIGLALGVGATLALASPDKSDLEDFDAYASIEEAEDGVDDSAGEPEEQADGEEEALAEAARDADERSCRETLAMVQDAHQEAIEKYSNNEEMVEHLSDLVERSGAASSGGTPMEFPEQLDDRFRPEAFNETIDDLVEECPDLFPEETTTNCDEYPCLVEFPSEHQARGLDVSGLCPEFLEQFGETPLYSSGFSFEGDNFVQLTPNGTGVGLREHLDEYSGNMQQRRIHRGQTRRREMATERYEEACMYEGDGQACHHIARALWDEFEERAVYLTLACEAGEAAACHSFATDHCIDRGQCDGESEQMGRMAVELDSENGRYHRTLATVVCQRGQQRQANGLWESACQLGDTISCDQRCGPS